MKKDPVLNLKFNNRECRKIKSAAQAVGLTVDDYVRSIVNASVKDHAHPVHQIIYEAVKSAGKKHPM